MTARYLEIATTNATREAQARYFGNALPARNAGGDDTLTARETAFIRARDSFYMATVSETGWPYVQHRGGDAGFLQVISDKTLAFADHDGNRQMLSVGNLATNTRVALFLMDYPRRTRLKILGHARIEDASLHPLLVPERPRLERQRLIQRIVFIDVVAYDWNCPQHITPRYSAAEVDTLITPLKTRIAELEMQLAQR